MKKALFLLGVFAMLLQTGHAATVTWSNTGGSNWLQGSNWSTGSTPGTTDTAQFDGKPTSNTVFNIDMGASTNNGTANQAVGAIEATANNTKTLTINNSSTTTNGALTLNGATVNGVSNVILRNASSKDLTIQNGTKNTDVVLGNATNNVVMLDGSGNIAISSNISGASKTLTIGGSSSGDLILSGTNTYSGGTVINGAKLRLASTSALPTTGNVAVNNDGRLRFSTAGTYGGVGQNLTFTPNQTASPSLDLQTSNIAVTWQGNVILDADTRIEANGASSVLTFSGNLSGSGALIKQAAGNLVLSGTGNTATGATQIGNGTLTVNSGSKLGTGDLTLAQTSANVTTLTLNNATQSVGTLSSTWGAITGTIDQRINLNGTALTVSQAVDATFGTGAVSTLTSTLAGVGSLIKEGAAQLILTSTNSYSGGTTVNNGTLVLGHATDTLADSGAVTIGGGILSIGNNSDTVGTVTLVSGSITGTGGTLTGSAYDVRGGSVSAKLGGSGIALSKSTSGTVTLAGANTYSGGTTVTNGILAASNNDAFGSGSIVVNGGSVVINSLFTVTNAFTLNGGTLLVNGTTGGGVSFGASGGTLAGSGSVASAVTLNNVNQVLAPGNSPGILTFGTSQAWTAFTYEWQINDWSSTTAGEAFDQVAITGNLDLAGATQINLDLATLQAGNIPGLLSNFSETNQSWIIAAASGAVQNFNASAWNIDTAGFQNAFTGNWSVTANSQNIYLNYTVNPVPEPSTWAMLVGGMGVTVFMLWRKRCKLQA